MGRGSRKRKAVEYLDGTTAITPTGATNNYSRSNNNNNYSSRGLEGGRKRIKKSFYEGGSNDGE